MIVLISAPMGLWHVTVVVITASIVITNVLVAAMVGITDVGMPAAVVVLHWRRMAVVGGVRNVGDLLVAKTASVAGMSGFNICD